MTIQEPRITRRNALRTAVGLSCATVAGCLGGNGGESTETPDDGNAAPDGQNTVDRIAVDGTALVVELTDEAEVDQINLIQPNGELFGIRDVATGAKQVSFEIGTAYEPGEYRVLALNGDETVVEATTEIRPDIQIRDVGLFRNNPEKPWDDVYGESKTDSKKNGESFVTISNTGNGPEAVVELRFAGDVPNPVDDPRGSGIYERDQVEILPGETVDLFSDSFPFGAEIGDEGMGCSTEGNSGQFTVILETRVTGQQVTRAFNVEYSGSDEMQDCEITISEA